MLTSLVNNIKYETNKPRNDGWLHFSSHLNHDRHTVLYYTHGYPETTWDRPWMNTLPLLQGTAIHEQLHKIMSDAYQVYEPETDVYPPEDMTQYKWKGTADALIEDNDGVVWLIDYKTISGASFSFLDGPKPEHIMQVSAYYHYMPLHIDKVAILYLPTSADYKRRWPEPVLYEVEPWTADALAARIWKVEEAISAYKSSSILPDAPEGKVYWKENKRNKNWELHYKPHYASMFCPWKDQEDDPCGCSAETPVHIGNWSEDRIEGDEDIVKAYLSECPGWTPEV